ncbi:hypothetical protein B0H15DRAFT_823128 [Mycena belliarum]|uniref:Uncharacterized protein n=1 Tax=Mycena belliarum TaxID=1033014 RepID=A0AAD6UGD7_9AGAR|nr:hypothetical protein B0H15DRAFT_823128 [Mycena belliae]
MFRTTHWRLFRFSPRSARNVSVGARHASGEASVGVVPGIPPSAQSTRTPSTYMSFAMPDISFQPPRPQVQIPYLPDFWDSSPPKSAQPAEPPLPKLSVVSDLNTSHSHNLHDENASPDTVSIPEPRPLTFGKGGILQDMSEDLGIPSPKEIKAGVSNFFQSFR